MGLWITRVPVGTAAITYIKFLVVRASAGRSLPAPGSFVNAAYIADGPGLFRGRSLAPYLLSARTNNRHQ